MNIGTGFQAILRFGLMKFERLLCWYYLWEGFVMYTFENGLGGMIYIQSFLKIYTGVQAVLKFCLSSFNGCNIGITDGRYLRNSPLMGSGEMI
jgi:hypothetical protein